MHSTSIILLGSGNVAAHLGPALKKAGYRISQVYSPNLENAAALASRLEARPVNQLEEVSPEADLYLVMLKDDALAEIADKLKLSGKLVIHTAGSGSIELLEACSSRRGVLYPLQTFSRSVPMELSQIPFFIESSVADDLPLIRELAAALSERVYEADSATRKQIHLAAVFASNFTNHMYAIASALMKDADIPFDVLAELMVQTTRKALQTAPLEVQTGPAVRFDAAVLESQLKLLTGNRDWQRIYRNISSDIQRMQVDKRKQD